MCTAKINRQWHNNPKLLVMTMKHQLSGIFKGTLVAGLVCLFSGIALKTTAQNCDASFYGDQIASATKARFIDSSSAKTNRGATHTWYYGDGQQETGQNLFASSHDYGQYGQYQVCHVVKDSNCVDSTCQQVTLSCDTSVSFSYNTTNQTVSFNASVRVADSFIWDFGDGTQGYTWHPDHTYSGTGSYSVTLKVIKNTSPRCVATTQRTVTINQAGPCDVNAAFQASGTGYQRTFSATDPDANSYTWDFGDGSTGTGASVSHTYSKKDTYDVTLIARDSLSANCVDTSTQQVIVESDNVISGALDLQQGQIKGSDSLTVELYRYDSCKGVYNKVQTTSALTGRDSSLYFFNDLPAGKYHVKADPGNNARLSSYVATYHRQAGKWGKADSIILQGISNTSYGNDITLLKSANSSGSGNITGYVGGTKASCNNKRQPENEPLANTSVLLLDEDREPVARTTTDEKGNYEFRDVAFNTYYVQVDRPGYEAKAQEVTLSSDQSAQTADFEVSNEQITPEETTGLAQSESGASVDLYPVPARSAVNISVSDAEAQELSLHITNMNGQLVKQQHLNAGTARQAVQLDVSTWQSGAYILQLQDEHGQVREARKLMVK